MKNVIIFIVLTWSSFLQAQSTIFVVNEKTLEEKTVIQDRSQKYCFKNYYAKSQSYYDSANIMEKVYAPLDLDTPWKSKSVLKKAKNISYGTIIYIPSLILYFPLFHMSRKQINSVGRFAVELAFPESEVFQTEFKRLKKYKDLSEEEFKKILSVGYRSEFCNHRSMLNKKGIRRVLRELSETI